MTDFSHICQTELENENRLQFVAFSYMSYKCSGGSRSERDVDRQRKNEAVSLWQPCWPVMTSFALKGFEMGEMGVEKK